MLIHLPRESGYGGQPRTKNGPVLVGYGAITISNRLSESMATLHQQLRRLLTWDRGKEPSAHTASTIATDICVYFADPEIPWQRDPNENTNGILRQCFPKGTDVSRRTADELDDDDATTNSTPRKILD